MYLSPGDFYERFLVTGLTKRDGEHSIKATEGGSTAFLWGGARNGETASLQHPPTTGKQKEI